MALSAEVAGAIVGGCIGIASALVTAAANYVTTKRRLRSKDRRRIAEFFLDEKVDALSSVHTKLTDCYTTIGKALESPSGYSWDRVKSEVHTDIDEFERAITVSDIYLTSDQEARLRETVGKYRSVADKIALLETGRHDMIDDVFDTTERAGSALAEEINAPIRRLEGEADGDSERSEQRDAEARWRPSRDGSGWTVLATQRDRIRDVIEVTGDGTVEFVARDIAPRGRATFAIIGRRYAYERDLVDSPTVVEETLRGYLDDSEEAFESFRDDADEHLMSDDEEYYVAPADIEDAIDWASEYVTPRADGESSH